MSNLAQRLSGAGAASTGGSANHIILLADTSSSAPTITILTSQIVANTLFIIKDVSGNAATNNVTIATQGAQTIDGETIINNAIVVDFGVVRLFVNGSNLLSW